MTTASAPARASSGWLVSLPFDAALAFGWLPFYAWILTTPLVGDVAASDYKPAFKGAVVIALGINFLHRFLVYPLFFGDPDKRARHPRAGWLLPLVFVIVIAARLAPKPAFDVVLWTIAVWNIWHTLMQRHGVARAYAAKAGGGLEDTKHGRRDLALLWSFTLFVTALVIGFRQETFSGAAKKAWGVVSMVLPNRESQVALVVVTALVFLACAAVWARAEVAASPRTSRAPRLMHIASTCVLLGVFVLHGPIVGFLVFSVGHAVEYVLFVHAYTRRRAATQGAPVAVVALGRAVPYAAVGAALLAVFAAAHTVWTAPVVVVAYTATSALHYLYDGIIWKLRRPEVRAQIVT